MTSKIITKTALAMLASGVLFVGVAAAQGQQGQRQDQMNKMQQSGSQQSGDTTGQSSAMQNGQSGSQQSGDQTSQSSAMQSGQSSSMNTQRMAATQQKVRQSLEKAGFQQVQIVDAAYTVHARTQDGQFVVMMIDPPSAAMMSAQNQSGQSGEGRSQ